MNRLETQLRFAVSSGDVDPYLIHWSAYPNFMDRAATVALAPSLSAEWLRAGHHLSVSAFRCTFERPLSFGAHVLLDSTAHSVAPDRVRIEHTFREPAAAGQVAAGVTEHRATRRGAAWEPVPLPVAIADDRPREVVPPLGEPPKAVGDPMVELRRRIHLRQADGAAALHWLAAIEWADEGTSELLAAVGHPISALLEARLGFPLAAANGGFGHGLCLDDEALVVTGVERVGRTSVAFAHRICTLAGHDVAWLRTIHVFVHTDTFQRRPVPAWLQPLSVGR